MTAASHYRRHASRLSIVAAFAAIYVFWGATYLFIKFGVETIPPFLMAGVRHVVAGVLLYLWAGLKGAERPTARQWGAASVLGTLMLFGGNGGVTWAELRVPSGLAALLVGAMPLWMALLDWLWHSRTRPGWRVAAGIAIGFAGIVLLVGPAKLAGGERVDPLGAAVLLLASLSWATGSLYSRRLHLPKSLVQAIAMQSLAGGAVLLLAGSASGEWVGFDPASVTLRSMLSLGFLIVFGSIIGFSCYLWLLHVTTPARVSTYAYVNPIIALALGWLLGGEAITLRTMIAAATIVVAVVLIVSHPVEREPREEVPITQEVETADLAFAPPPAEGSEA